MTQAPRQAKRKDQKSPRGQREYHIQSKSKQVSTPSKAFSSRHCCTKREEKLCCHAPPQGFEKRAHPWLEQLERAITQGKVQIYGPFLGPVKCGSANYENKLSRTQRVHAEVCGIMTFDFVPFTFDDDANSSKTAVREYQSSSGMW